MAGAHPNALGRFLRYFTDAFAYAGATKATNARRYSSNSALSSILEDNSRMAHGGDGNLDYYTRLGVTNPFFFYALKIISDRVADVGQFYMEEQRKDGWERLKTHEFLDVLASPNSVMTGSLLLGLVSEWMSTVGNAYLFLVTDTPGVGPIREIWPLPSTNIQPEPMTLRVSPYTGKPIIDYRYTLSSPVILPGENVVHIRTPNLFDFWRGMAPLSALQSILTMDAAETSWLAGYFGENNAVPTAVISVPPDLDDATFDAVRRDIIEQFGAQRRSAVTRAGDIKVETIQHTIEEMRVLEGMEFNRKAIWQVLRVPAGLTEATSGQSRMAADMALMRDAIQPTLNNIASWLTLKAMPMYGDGLRVVAENVIPQDSAIETAEYAAYSPDRTLQENRRQQKLEPLRLGGDLAHFQPLFDEVPQRWVELFASLLAGGGTAQGGEISPQSQAGGAAPNGAAQIGPRVSGQSTSEQVIANLLGGDAKRGEQALAGANGAAKALPLRAEEEEAAEAWLHGRAIKAAMETGENAVQPSGRGERSFVYTEAGVYWAGLGADGAWKSVYRARADGALLRWDGRLRRWRSADTGEKEKLVVVDAKQVQRFLRGPQGR